MRNPITIEKTRQIQLQSTLIKLLQAGKGTVDPVAQGLLRITLTPSDFATTTDDELTARDITRDELTQLRREHPFGIEVNLSDNSKRAESDVADNVLDLNLANLHAVAMDKGNPANQAVITRLYQQYDQQRLFLRQLAIPEEQKIQRADTIVQHFFNAVGTVLSNSGIAKPDKLPKLISHWLQEYRSERAQRDHVSIQVNRGKYITNFLDNDAETSAHIQSYRRWYLRDDEPRPTATAHNYASEVPNFAAITEASVKLNATNTPTISVTHIGQSHGSLAPAVEYSTKGSTVSTEHKHKKHLLTLKAHTNMRRLTLEDKRNGDFRAHVYTHLLTVSEHHGALQGQFHQFLDQRMAAYTLPEIIYMDYGINSARDHLNTHQPGINNMAMIALYQHFIDAIEPCAEFPAIELMGRASASNPAETAGATLYHRYLTCKEKLTESAESYITTYSKRLQLSAEHDNPDTTLERKVQIQNLLRGDTFSMGHIEQLREQVKQHEQTVHGLASDLADMIKYNVDNRRAQTSVTTALPEGSTKTKKVTHYAKQAMFVIQQLREMNTASAVGDKKIMHLTQYTKNDKLGKAVTWKSSKANGVLQAMIQIVSSSIGLHTSSGCKSANDRQYVVAATVSALAKRMERGEPIATTDLKGMLAVLNGERQAEYGKNAAALQTVLDNGGYPKAKGGSALSKPAKDGVGAGAGESASVTTKTVRYLGLFKKKVIVAREDQGTASDTFASHKIKERMIVPSDKTTVRQITMSSQSNEPNTVLFNATTKLVSFQAKLKNTEKHPGIKANFENLINTMLELHDLSDINSNKKIHQALVKLSSFMLGPAMGDSDLMKVCQNVFDDIVTLRYGERETLLLTISDKQPKAGQLLAANAAIANQLARLDVATPAVLPADRPATAPSPRAGASAPPPTGGVLEEKGGQVDPDSNDDDEAARASSPGHW